MAVTQKEIAQRLNISTSSVTKVLNGSKIWISPENRERILKMAAELNYHANPAARALVNGRYDTVGLAYIRPVGYARTELSGACEILAERLGEIGFELKVKVVPDAEHLTACMNEMAARRNVDAVVLLGTDDDLEEQGMLLECHEIPFVIKGRFEDTHPAWNQVDYDHEGMMRRSVARLAALGHRRIAYLGFAADTPFVTRLVDGYRHGLIEAEIKMNPALVAHTNESSSSSEGAMTKWLELPDSERPTALVAASGNYAWSGIERALGLKALRMGEETGSFPVTGMCVGPLALSFGRAMAFQEVSFAGIASAMFDAILSPILMRHDVPKSIVRVHPEFTPVYSQRASDYAEFRVR